MKTVADEMVMPLVYENIKDMDKAKQSAIYTLVQITKGESRFVEVNPYDCELLKAFIPQIKELSQESLTVAKEPLKDMLAASGVIIVYLPIIDDITSTCITYSKGNAIVLGIPTAENKNFWHLLDEALKSTVTITYNRVSVDGDTSTNDSIFILANGQANNPTITEKDENYYTFVNVLKEINTIMAKNIAKDGEGATKLLECQVIGAANEKDAVLFGKSVINSSLVKTAMFGSDANWGRILCALGYANVDFDPEKVDVSFESCAGEIEVCKNGSSVAFDEDKAKKVLDQKEIIIKINLSQGECTAYVWGCDLSYEYVKINGDYRS